MSPGETDSASNTLRVTLKPAPVWAFLEERDISQNELARLVGISSGYLSQLMSGRAHPSPRVRQRLLGVLGLTDFDDLFTISG
ncbi:MAG: helix-turn-helix transcriptional regulator [Gemmatimonadetes bacterium]|nr:helix-turn-helix transcriptional regulator [Gemmatimonadota bacterium]